VYHQFEVHNFPHTVVYRKPLDAPLFTFDTPTVSIAKTRETRPATGELRNDGRRTTDDGREVAALVKLAHTCADRGDWLAAEQHCAQALERDPLSIEAHYLLAQIHEHQGALERALAGYRRTVYLDWQFVPGLIGMADIWRQMGRAAESRRYYQNALKRLAQLDPGAPVPNVDGATAGELIALVNRQLLAVA
jgi:chemotaxis protein methyltransferase CheR